MMARSAKGKVANESEKDDRNTSPTVGEEAINLRENFNALAVFAPSVKTDSNE